MNSLQKFEKIVDWYSLKSEKNILRLKKRTDFSILEKIEKLIGENIPENIHELLCRYNGQEGNRFIGSFLGTHLMDSQRIISIIENSKTFIKPKTPRIEKPSESAKVVASLLEHVKKNIPFENWYKVDFECSPGHFRYPHIYFQKNLAKKDREIVQLDRDIIDDLIKLSQKLHILEANSYNWDFLKIELFQNQKSIITRCFNDDATLLLSSHPEEAIKLKHFHIKWLPILHDYGGNYFAIDLDPDSKGTKGQVIITASRDTNEMFVVANSWDEFLDFLLNEIKTITNFPEHYSELFYDLVKKLKVRK